MLSYEELAAVQEVGKPLIVDRDVTRPLWIVRKVTDNVIVALASHNTVGARIHVIKKYETTWGSPWVVYQIDLPLNDGGITNAIIEGIN